MRIALSLALILALLGGVDADRAAAAPDGRTLFGAEPVAYAVVRGVFGTIQARVDAPVATRVHFGFAGGAAPGHLLPGEPTFQGFGFAGPPARVTPVRAVEVVTGDAAIVEPAAPTRRIVRRTYRRPRCTTYGGSSCYASTYVYDDCAYDACGTAGPCSPCWTPCYRTCRWGCGYRIRPRIHVAWGRPAWGYGWGRPWGHRHGWSYGWGLPWAHGHGWGYGWGGYWW